MPRPGRRNRLATQSIHILDLTTTHWENTWWLQAQGRELDLRALGYSKLPNSHAVKNFGHFRDYLLRIHKGGGGYCLSDFAVPPGFPGLTPRRGHQDFGPFETFPAEAAAWCKTGRRLYRIDHSLQKLLRLTSLNNVAWQQVRWPFDSFAIELAQPIADPTGRAWDFILVSTYNNEDLLLPGGDGPVLQMSFFSRSRSCYEPIRTDDKAKLEAHIARREWTQAAMLYQKLDERFRRPVVIPRSVFRYPKANLAGLVMDTAARWRDELMHGRTAPLPQGAYEVWDAMIRVVAGLALYLKTLPSVSKQVVKTSKPRRDGLPDVTVITDSAEIFTVSTVIPLTPEELEIETITEQLEGGGKAKYEMRAHWRQGYWSRKPGEGRDPDAEKSVWHRPTLVRADRLPPDLGLPRGAVTEDKDH